MCEPKKKKEKVTKTMTQVKKYYDHMTQVVRTVLQEERRDEGVPRPKARQVFTFDLSENPHKVFLSPYLAQKIMYFHPIFCPGCKRIGDSRGPKVALQVFFSHIWMSDKLRAFLSFC